MATIFQIFLFVLVGVLLLWFGFTIFFAVPGAGSLLAFKGKNRNIHKPKGDGTPGAPRTCPVCSAKLGGGERVKSVAFPSMGGAERFMHISGCTYCLEGERRRVCPVCNAVLRSEEFLVARLYEKPGRSHVHVLGCSRCKMKRK
jgi:hypothetical protein